MSQGRSLVETGSGRAVSLGLCHVNFEYIQGWRLCSMSCSARISCSSLLTCYLFVLSLDTAEKSLAMSFLLSHTPTSRHLETLLRSHTSLFFSRPESQLSPSSCERFFSSLIVLVEVNKMLHLIRGIRIQRRKCFCGGGKKQSTS